MIDEKLTFSTFDRIRDLKKSPKFNGKKILIKLPMDM
jgi:hypothetical protein